MAFTKTEWWITNARGQRIGYLYPEDFAAILESFYGERKWVVRFAADFGFSRSAVDRWKDGKNPIPRHVAMILNMLSAMKNRKIPISPVDAPWLPVIETEDEEPADAGTD